MRNRTTAIFSSFIVAGFMATLTTPALAASKPASKAPTPEILPFQIRETIKRGQTITVPLTLKNVTKTDTLALIPAGNAVLGGLGFPTSATAGDSQLLPKGDLMLKVVSPTLADLTITVPQNQAPGLYVAGGEIAQPSRMMSKARGKKISAQVNVVERVVAPIFLTVPGSVATTTPTLGILNESTAQGEASIIELTNPEHAVLTQPIPVSLTVSRNGKVIVSAQQTFTNVQPASTAVSNPIPWRFTLQPGTYTITASGKGMSTVTKSVTISAPTAKTANQNSNGYYHVAKPQASIPVFDLEIAGVGLGVLGLLTALLLFLKRRSRG